MERGLIAIATAISVLAGCTTGIGEVRVFASAVEAMGKNPDAASKIRSMAIIGAAISETCAIYGLLIAFMLFSKI